MNAPADRRCYPVIRHSGNQPPEKIEDCLASETTIILAFAGLKPVVTAATPTDLEDFAIGFSLSAGIIRSPGDLMPVEITASEQEIAIHLRLASSRFEELEQNPAPVKNNPYPDPRPITEHPAIVAAAIDRALAALPKRQLLARLTNCAHAAAWCSPNGEIRFLREDVSRHAAFDKMIGARAVLDDRTGFAVITSRTSREIVRKAAQTGIGLLVAVSAPTAQAVELARQTGVALIGFARQGRWTLYSHPERLAW